MYIVIVGDGKVGYTLAKHLSEEGNDVVIIDKNMEALKRTTDNLDVMCIKGSGTSVKVLKEAEVNRADVMIAVTNRDERNALCCLLAKKLGAKYTIARIRDPEYASELNILKNELGMDMVINPEREAALEIGKLIKFPSICSVENFADGNVDLVSFRLVSGDNIVGKPISEIKFPKTSVIICAVEREHEVFIPTGDFVLEENDKIYVIGDHDNIETFLKNLRRYKKRVKNVMISGGGKIAYYLTESISKIGAKVTIVEKEYDRCEKLNELLPEAIIINGDGTDQDFLESENLKEMDAFIALTGRDEENLISSLFALNAKVNNVIAKITRVNYNGIVKQVGVQSVVSPKMVTANKIIGYLRALKNKNGSSIKNLYKIVEEKAEALEFLANETTKCLNIPLKDINFKKGVLVAAIVRDSKTIIPGGNDCIKNGDGVILVTDRKNVMDINEILMERGV
ncbi:Trk system potassium transporter TrkA [Clostridium hydrogeniformans]|uniref:Trk system potassium transporter TrkA n=1 Tax=Clostridium hydrogeniformans TaxID=349933 RepID=UPI0004850608|nr:Trk system potassium transporter TrkA [Clostridium hydrogeniformans]